MKFFIVAALIAAVSAEPAADAEADPALVYSSLGYRYSPYAYNYGVRAYSAYSPYYYGGYASAAYSPYAYNYGAYRLFKREAEAEADPALAYTTLGYNYHPYAATYATAAYTTPYAYNYAAPYAYGAYSYGYTPAVYGAYANAGRYYANSGGAVHVAKREAEAEADPAILYSGLGYNYAAPYAYAGYRAAYTTPYAAYSAFPYRTTYGYPYGYRSYGYYY